MISHAHATYALSIFDPAKLGISAADLRTIAILVVFVLLFALEALGGHLKTPPKTTRQSYFSNLGTLIMNDTLMSVMSVSGLMVLAGHFSQWGLLRHVPDTLLKAVLSFLALDLALYLWHRVNHTFDWLWMFHKVHHSDPSMNVTTAFRLHFVEVFLTVAVKVVLIVLMGVEPSLVLVNEALITLLVMFHHANIRFAAEHWLAKIFVMPYLHRVHHSTLRKEHDNNYGAVFSIWDRLFGSFAEKQPEKIGLAGVRGMGVLELVWYGLSWSWIPSSEPITETRYNRVEKMIAEAAYYRSMKRGFLPGYDFIDWVEAEREILSRLGKGKPKGKDKPDKRRLSFLFCCR